MLGEINDIIVIIPVYKNELSSAEIKSLKHTIDVLGRYDIMLIKPRSVNLSFLQLIPEIQHKVSLEDFDDYYFQSRHGYNRLLLSKEFYKRFCFKKYMLICQLDAYIFEDSLRMWTTKHFDYIGAPWPQQLAKLLWNSSLKGKMKVLMFMKLINRIFFGKKDYYIGNGGLSLRNIKKCLFVLKVFSFYVDKWKGNEDVFWSIIAPMLFPFFKVPNLNDGLGFAFEKSPKFFFKLNNNQLPFGCHGWEKYDPEFWKKFVLSTSFLIPISRYFLGNGAVIISL